jgi:hypothetical protein
VNGQSVVRVEVTAGWISQGRAAEGRAYPFEWVDLPPREDQDTTAGPVVEDSTPDGEDAPNFPEDHTISGVGTDFWSYRTITLDDLYV